MNFIKLALACLLLLLLMACGQGDAMEETRLKAEGGDASAQSIMGSSYYDGRNGLSQDYVKGVEWFRKAAEQGEPYALRMVANSYYHGKGISRDYAQAAYWYRKAAEQGDPYGQEWIGGAYAEGPEVLYKGFSEPQDLVLGYAWLNIESKGYGEETAKRRDALESKLSPAELAEAQRLSSAWRRGQSIQRERPATP